MKVSRTAWTTALAGVPIILIGDYGIGKTTIAKKFAKFNDKDLVHAPLIGALPEDLIGFPYKVELKEESGQIIPVTMYAPPYWFKQVKEGAVLLLDEVGRADNDRLQNAIAQILDKSLGQYALPEDTIIIGTTNNYDIGGLNELNYNILTRAAWYSCSITTAEETNALLNGTYNIEENFRRLPKDWRKYELGIRLKLASFYKARPGYFNRAALQEFEDDGDKENKNSAVRVSTWPNPRTIHKYAIPAAAAAVSVGYSTLDDISDIFKATLGPVFADGYTTWYASGDLPTPDKAYEQIANTMTLKVKTVYIYVVMSEIREWMQDKPVQEQRKIWSTVMKYISKIEPEQGEIALYCMKLFLNISDEEKEIMGPIPNNLLQRLKGLV